MPHDLLQIALEHHRAGRFRSAEAGYRAILQADPDNAEATHWLGVLAFQAGRPDYAIPLLQRAADLRPTDASFWHNLAHAHLAAGRSADAVDAFTKALAIEPTRGETLFGLGMACLARQGQGDAQAAADAFRKARESGLDLVDLHYQEAVALVGAGKLDEAISACKLALENRPHYAAAWYQLAVAHRLKGDAKEVRKALLKAVELDPTLAHAWFGLGILDAEEGQHAIAAGLFRRAIRAKRDFAAAYQALGRALQMSGKSVEAMDAFAAALRAGRGDLTHHATPLPLATALGQLEDKLTDPAITELHYALAAQSDQSEMFPPSTIPPPLLESLFDRYADSFDAHLTGNLHYCVPELIAGILANLHPAKKLDILDLGCGTGLCGRLLKPMANTLVGVDLSPAMIEKSRSREVYDLLEVGELVQMLKKSPAAYDLLVAADVLIYLGDLNPTFEAAARSLRPGGLFIFSVEAGEGERYQFHKKTRRFTHSQQYLQKLTDMHGFKEESFQPVVGRYEAEKPVPGYLVVLRRPER